MDSALEILGWLCLGLGALLTGRGLCALLAARRDGGPRRAGAWSDLRAGTAGMAVGLSDVAGRSAHGVLWWLITTPLFTVVLMTVALWLRPRVMRWRARLQ